MSKHITRIGQGLTTTILVAYFWYRFYLVAVLYYYPPIPEENRNKIIQNLYQIIVIMMPFHIAENYEFKDLNVLPKKMYLLQLSLVNYENCV